MSLADARMGLVGRLPGVVTSMYFIYIYIYIYIYIHMYTYLHRHPAKGIGVRAITSTQWLVWGFFDIPPTSMFVLGLGTRGQLKEVTWGSCIKSDPQNVAFGLWANIFKELVCILFVKLFITSWDLGPWALGPVLWTRALGPVPWYQPNWSSHCSLKSG